MKTLVISDVHAQIDLLTKALECAGWQPQDRLIFPGDQVTPSAILLRLSALRAVVSP